MAQQKVKGCFYVDGKLKTVDISGETERRVYERAYDKRYKDRVSVAQVYKDAYEWARGIDRRKLTEALLVQFLDMTAMILEAQAAKPNRTGLL